MSILSQEFDLDTLAKQLWAIGDPVRLRILELLPTESSSDAAFNVSTIADRIGLSQPATSHHLRILRQAGLVTHKKMCRDMFYWIQVDIANDVIGKLNELLAKDR